MKKILIAAGIILVLITGYIIFKKYIMENIWCKTEDGRYEIWAFTPIDVTDRIEKEGCKCLSGSLLWNPDPLLFDYRQLQEIRKELPGWAVKNVKDFSEEDKKDLAQELNRMSDAELLKKLKYRYSFFAKLVDTEVPVYTIKIKSVQAYCLNYFLVYEVYDGKYSIDNDPEPFGKKPNYPIIENEDWARNEFGEAGVVSLNNKEKNHTKAEREAFIEEKEAGLFSPAGPGSPGGEPAVYDKKSRLPEDVYQIYKGQAYNKTEWKEFKKTLPWPLRWLL
jgi:hypothetical protein